MVEISWSNIPAAQPLPAVSGMSLLSSATGNTFYFRRMTLAEVCERERVLSN